MPAGAGSGAPLLIGLSVVGLTAGGIGYFLFERSKERKAMSLEEQRVEREKARRKAPPPGSAQTEKR